MILVASDCMIPSVGAIHCCRSQAARVNVDSGAARHLAEPHDEKRHRRRRRAVRRRHHLTRVEPPPVATCAGMMRSSGRQGRWPRASDSKQMLYLGIMRSAAAVCTPPDTGDPARVMRERDRGGNGSVSLRRARAARHPEAAQAGRSPVSFPCCLGRCPKRMSHPAL